MDLAFVRTFEGWNAASRCMSWHDIYSLNYVIVFCECVRASSCQEYISRDRFGVFFVVGAVGRPRHAADWSGPEPIVTGPMWGFGGLRWVWVWAQNHAPIKPMAEVTAASWCPMCRLRSSPVNFFFIHRGGTMWHGETMSFERLVSRNKRPWKADDPTSSRQGQWKEKGHKPLDYVWRQHKEVQWKLKRVLKKRETGHFSK